VKAAAAVAAAAAHQGVVAGAGAAAMGWSRHPMRGYSFPTSLALLLLALAAGGSSKALLAQHETAADLLDGERAYGASCVACHGPDGNQVSGIDLHRGVFRRPYTDQELVGIIRNGIPNTAMPPNAMNVEQASKLVAYLRSLAAGKKAVVAADAARGKLLFDGKGGCASCHRINGVGSRVGPDLSRIGQQRRAAELETSLLDPASDVQPRNRFYRVVLRDGTAVTGRLLSHDTFTVQLIDTKEQLRSFVKTDLREHGFAESPMPSYRGKLSPQEIADLVGYLASLKASK
jgi:putative heme-binding domain-containing protein